MTIVQDAFGGISAVRYCDECGRPLSNPASIAAGMGPICRGKHGAPASWQKKELDAPMEEFNAGERFDYLGYGKCASHCYIRINGNKVICTEAPDNPGTSITNLAEGIATLVCRDRGIPFHKLIWIEHYIDRGIEPQETFDFVTFTIDGDRLVHPQWKYAGKEAAMKAFNG